MLALRYAALLALAVWIGGLLALGIIAAPAIFEVTAASGIAGPRTAAGAIVGEILRRFHLVAYGCGAVIVLSLLVRAILGPRPRRFAIRAGIALLMLGASLYSGLVVSSAIGRVQRDLGGVAVSSLPEADGRRIEFIRLHQHSTVLHFVPLVGGLLLMFWELKD
jgi:hypothetical protein